MFLAVTSALIAKLFPFGDRIILTPCTYVIIFQYFLTEYGKYATQSARPSWQRPGASRLGKAAGGRIS
jgi:hypothetical protein